MSTFNLGGFEVIERIGVGGMATVWKARQVSLDRIVAIKILSSQLAADPADVSRFQSEAQAAARLKHPGIVQVYDANAQDAVYYFVMEYVAGYTVGDWVRRKGRLSLEEALLVGECVVDALQYAWETAGIIHCDIKPDNVMVDADGTVKVADLGLSRTISAMANVAEPDEIMGTPAYVSPEQARGVRELDFRADVYSLGAMLYHLVTGKMLFESRPEEEVMDLQVTSTVPDAMDLLPGVSVPMCWLLEKMLAKDPAHRHGSWDEVRADLERVKQGLSPIGHLAAPGLSTMQRSRHRTRATYTRWLNPKGEDDTVVAKLTLPAVLVAVAAVAFGVIWALKQNQAANSGRTGDSPSTLPSVQPPRNPVPPKHELPHEQKGARLLREAKAWTVGHPADIDGAIARYEAIAKEMPDSKVGQQARAEAELLRDARQTRVQAVLRTLKRQTDEYESRGDLLGAAELVEGYSGEFAEQTRALRLAMAKRLRDRQREHDEKLASSQTAAMRYRDLLDAVARDLATEGLDAATRRVNAAKSDPLLSSRRGELDRIAVVLGEIRLVEQRVLRTFASQVGKTTEVELASGKRSLLIRRVTEGRVVASDASTGAAHGPDVEFTFADLSPREKLVRLGADDTPSVAMVKGLMALESKAYPHARRYLKRTECVLTEPLLLCADDLENGVDDAQAESALRSLLGAQGVEVGAYDVSSWLAAVKQAGPLGASAHTAIEAYRQKFGRTAFCKGSESILGAIDAAAVQTTNAAPAVTSAPVQ